jgi:multidrug resistance efflux pump
VVDLSGLVISASVNQVDAQQVRIGQPVKIHFDAYPDLTADGRVVSVAAIAGGSGGGFGSPGGGGMQVKTIPVQIAFEPKDVRIIPDLSVAADVMTGERGQVLAAPNTAT